MKRSLLTLSTLMCLILSLVAFAGPSGDNLENPAWDAKKVPPTTEPPLKASVAQEWTAVSNQKPTQSCSAQTVWKVLPLSKIDVTVLKEIKVPVKGTFDHFVGYFYSDKKTGQVTGGQGSVDLASWDSKLEARDRRVQRYVFDVEKPGMSVANVTFKFSKGFTFPHKGTSDGEVDVDVAMEGNHYKLNFPVKATRTSEKALQLVTVREGSFTYATDDMKPRILKMMEICNHHFLSAFAHVGFNLSLENTCSR